MLSIVQEGALAREPALAGVTYRRYQWTPEPSSGEGLLMLPEGLVEVVIQPHAQTSHHTHYSQGWHLRQPAFVGGLHSRAYWLRTREGGEVFSLRFAPVTFAAYCPIPLHHFHNQLILPEDVWGLAGRSWATRMLEAPGTASRIALAQAFLKQQARPGPAPRIRQAVQAMETLPDSLSVEALARGHCYSPSRFRQLFREQVGMAPKAYFIIRRLNQALQQFSQHASLTELSTQLGYHDQAHFIHECKKITGLSPRQLLTHPSLFGRSEFGREEI